MDKFLDTLIYDEFLRFFGIVIFVGQNLWIFKLGNLICDNNFKLLEIVMGQIIIFLNGLFWCKFVRVFFNYSLGTLIWKNFASFLTFLNPKIRILRNYAQFELIINNFILHPLLIIILGLKVGAKV